MPKKNKGKKVRSSLEKAVALRYDQEKETSPRVVAKGKGYSTQLLLRY